MNAPKKSDFNNYGPNIEPLNQQINYDKIIINVDDTFESAWFDSKYNTARFRVLNFYQKKQNNKFINEFNCVISAKIGSLIDIDYFTEQKIREIIKKYYGDINKFQIVMCGDGVKFIKSIADKLDAKLILDKWHCYKKVSVVFNSKNLSRDQKNKYKIKNLKNKYKKEIYKALQNANPALVLNLINESINEFKKLELKPQKLVQIRSLSKYIKNNFYEIQRWKDKLVEGCYTESKVQQYVKSWFGGFGRIFSIENYLKLLSFKCCIL